MSGADAADAAVASVGGPAADAEAPLFSLRGLTVTLPDGGRILDGVDLEVRAGELVALVGPSGAGKSTLLRALFDRAALESDGYAVATERLAARVPLGLVPQRGAPFDHLDVAGNLALALRHARPRRRASRDELRRWLEAVDLPAEWASARVEVSRLSGGQAQRLAVARTLAGARRLLFLDEPSAGLDPHRVRQLAALLRRLAEEGAGIVLVTHELELALAADRVLLLERGALVDPTGGAPPPRAEPGRAELGGQLLARLAATPGPPRTDGPSPRARGRLRDALAPLGMAAASLGALPRALAHPGDLARLTLRTLRLAALRPLPFYAVVSLLLGFTVLYVMTHVAPEGVSRAQVVRQIGGSYVTALAPPVSAFLFVAASGSSLAAWLGGMSLTGQLAALEALGISRRAYLWTPTWLGLAASYALVLFVFAGGLLVGGLALCRLEGIADALPRLAADLVDPRPDRARFLGRALWLGALYAVGIASDVVARGDGGQRSAEAVTRSMTASVVSVTLWVVALELGSALWLLAGGR